MRVLVAAMMVILLLPHTAAAAPGDRWDADTATAVLEGEMIGGLVGGGLGLVGGFVVASAVPGSRDGMMLVVGALVGVAIGTVIGLPIGAQLGGDSEHGTGRWWATGLGEVVGLGASAGLVYLLKGADSRAATKAVILASMVLIIAGPFVGYELSSDEQAPTASLLSGRF